MDRISLKAQERVSLGKKVKSLRRQGLIPGHVFGNKVESENVSVNTSELLKVFKMAGESGLIDLKIGAEKVRPVLIRGIQNDPLRHQPLHVDFYQVDLTKKVAVPVPIELIGEEPEVVKSGEAVVIQPIGEIEVEALPAELPEKIVVDISSLQQIDDAILVTQLNVPAGVTVLAEPEAVVVKLDTAITEEMKKLMEEQAAEAAAAQAAAAEEAGAEAEAKPEEAEVEELGRAEAEKPAEQPASEKPSQESS